MYKNTFPYPDVKSIVICGDIHGDFEMLSLAICSEYDMHDTLVIVAGDCGFGFAEESSYPLLARRIQRALASRNCYIAMIRGNHDDPSFFEEQKIRNKRFRTIPDYSIISACEQNILCVGGAISIDRSWRLREMSRFQSKRIYWSNEVPRYDATLMDEIAMSGIQINVVVTHTAPSFCEITSTDGLRGWAINDSKLLADCKMEREQMDMLFAHLKRDKHSVTHWFYGHFHQSWHGEYDGIRFRMLDIMELCPSY